MKIVLCATNEETHKHIVSIMLVTPSILSVRHIKFEHAYMIEAEGLPKPGDFVLDCVVFGGVTWELIGDVFRPHISIRYNKS